MVRAHEWPAAAYAARKWSGAVAISGTGARTADAPTAHGLTESSNAPLPALRLGWAIAETRGRLRLGPPAEGESPGRAHPGRALPLGGERSWQEQTIEIERVACALAAGLDLDFDVAELAGGATPTGTRASGKLTELSKELALARRSGDAAAVASAWQEFSEFIYLWDARIQDALAADSIQVASGYQLGRGVAETYWALEPERSDANDPRSWQFLLGEGRVAALRRLLVRLSSSFPEFSAVATSRSLGAWAKVAKDADLPAQPETIQGLRAQLRIWHDLLLTGEPPQALVGRTSMLKQARRLGPVLRAFLPEASIALIGAAAAAAAAALFAAGSRYPGLAGALVVLGVFGVTSSAALAKAKNEANALLAKLRAALNLDLIVEAVTQPPARAFLDRGRRSGHRS